VLSSQENPREYKGRYLKLYTLTLALLVAFTTAVFWFLARIRSQFESQLSASLHAVLETTNAALQMWVEDEEENATALAQNHDLQLNVEKQLRISRDVPYLRASTPLKQIRKLLDPAIRNYRLPGFAIIAPDGVQIAAYPDDEVGANEIVDHNPDLISKVMKGTTNLGLPYNSQLFLNRTRGEYPVMSVTAPIRNDAGYVIAALALLVDPQLKFTRAMQLARLAETGETYAFDRVGRLLTESRFEEQLRRAGILPSNESSSILSVSIRDPGGNTVEGYRSNTSRDQQPLTRMAQSAVTGNAGIDLHGYRDYRGVPVIGAWLWADQFKMGLTTELDVKEAFAPYQRFRDFLTFLLVVTLGLLSVLFVILRHRDRLLASNRDYRQTMKARDDMMAIVAHDLKNPLNTLLLESYVLRRAFAEYCGSESLTINHTLELQEKTARHMNRLIGDLTDATKIHAGRLSLERQECTLQQTLEPAIERMQLLSHEKGVEFAANVPTRPCVMSVDQSRITQVLDNLLGNSLKFTPEGGKITVNVSILENEVQTSVADTGPGIPNDALSRIFEPYWQVEKTSVGMGLGLFIAKNIIEGHGGRMWVESSVGRGTTFYFTLPSVGTTL